ncbi:sulfur carrier protein ThiS [Methylophaga thiooxydans]|uniref:sulfur carrier protein ThiS n=1 Tax=Methylophaga thiooxydans TaxID=392484 RepID=UPI002356A752|nr:sulfur carrier protein ThiS [Methylophaga thiooxydans]
MTSKQQIIELNGESMDAAEMSSVADLIEQKNMTGGRFVVVVNDEVVPKSSWAQTSINAGDKVDIMSPISGG